MFDKNDARVEQERAEAEEKRQRRDALGLSNDAIIRSNGCNGCSIVF